MYVRRGNFTHSLNEATFRWRKLPQWADNGQLIGTRIVAALSGRLTGNDATALAAAVQQLEAAYAATTGNFVLLQNDGSTETPWKIDGSKAIGGIRCTRLEYPNQSPGEWTTYLNYELEIEANMGGVSLIGGVNAPQSAIVSWNESLTFRGNGGPRRVLLECRNAMPQMQVVSQRTPVYANQRGSAVGLYRYPQASSPIWPQYELEPEREISRDSASVVGGAGSQQQQRNYRITWSYSFAAPSYVTGTPSSGF